MGLVVVVRVGAGLTDTGTWIPTWMASLCCAAAERRPVTKGEVATGLARERDSWGVVPM